jgi:hypothetical protein
VRSAWLAEDVLRLVDIIIDRPRNRSANAERRQIIKSLSPDRRPRLHLRKPIRGAAALPPEGGHRRAVLARTLF